MKKIIVSLFIFISLFFSLNILVEAKTLKDAQAIACEYNIKCPGESRETLSVDDRVRIEIYGYDFTTMNSNAPTSSKILFIDENDSFREYNKKNDKKKYQHFEDIKHSGFKPPLLILDGGVLAFAQKYASDGQCPKMVCSTTNETFYAEPVDHAINNAKDSLGLSSNKEELQSSNGIWQDRNSFFGSSSTCSNSYTRQECINHNLQWDSTNNCCKEESTSVEVKDDKVCTYENVNFKGEYYDSCKKKNVTISFVTHYIPGTNNKSYNILIDNKESGLTSFQSLNVDFKGNVSGDNVTVKAAHLKQYFTDGETCPAAELVIPYLDDVTASVCSYTITTSAEEATANVIDEDFPGDDDDDDDDYKDGVPIPDIDIGSEPMECSALLGPNLTKIVSTLILIFRIAGAIFAIIKAMTLLLPAIIAKDAEGLKSAGKKCVSVAIILALICLLPALCKLIGSIAGFDITCLV